MYLPTHLIIPQLEHFRDYYQQQLENPDLTEKQREIKDMLLMHFEKVIQATKERQLKYLL